MKNVQPLCLQLFLSTSEQVASTLKLAPTAFPDPSSPYDVGYPLGRYLAGLDDRQAAKELQGFLMGLALGFVDTKSKADPEFPEYFGVGIPSIQETDRWTPVDGMQYFSEIMRREFTTLFQAADAYDGARIGADAVEARVAEQEQHDSTTFDRIPTTAEKSQRPRRPNQRSKLVSRTDT